MQRGAQAPELKQAFEAHNAETEVHVERLQQVFEIIGKRAQGKPAPQSMASSRKARTPLRVQGHACASMPV
jgi:ferritin-like metal-binding protein YciE